MKSPPAFAPLDESHPDRPEWWYALSKQVGETMADAFVRWHPNLSIASLRFTNVFADSDYAMLPAIKAKPDSRRLNFWGYVDAQDAGKACQLAVDAPLLGHQRMLIAAADTLVDIPTAELMRTHFPDVPLRSRLLGNVALLSTKCAYDLIGYHAQKSWRDR